MIVSDLAVTHRTTVFFLTLVIILSGLWAYRALPLESAPDVKIPNVFVSTTYRGVSPEDIEKSITIEIEKKLKGLEGVKKIESTSSLGSSSINIEFNTDVDIDDALIKVKDKVDLAKAELPTDLEDDPSVFEVNLSEMPVLGLVLAGPCGLRQLTRLAETLEEEIEGIPGVLDLEIVGGVKREIQILIDPDRMALYAIPFSAIDAVVRGENSNVSGGVIRTKEGRYQLRVPGEFKTKEDVENLVVASRGGGTVFLRDLATVVDGLEDKTSYSRMNGADAVTMYVKKRSGENVVRIVDAVTALVAEAAPSFPEGTTVTRIRDRAKEIRNMVADLENNIATGFLLVIVVVCVAMGFRNAVLVSLSIPLSMLITFIVLQALGITLNMVVLFSLTLALGMLVDNAIVIVENIYRFMQQGVPRLEAAMHATSEVAWPIIGSGLTTIVAFVPLLGWEGVMGGFMVFLPKTVIITLAACLFVALVVNPALAAVLMKAPGAGAHASAAEVMAGGEHPMLTGGGRILGAYRWILRRALQWRLAVVAGAGLVLVGTVMVWLLRVGLVTPQEFFPSVDPSRAMVRIKTPRGADLDYADRLVREVAVRLFDARAGSAAEEAGEVPRVRYADAVGGDRVSHLPGVEFVAEKSVADAGMGSFEASGGNEVAVDFVDLADRPESTRAVVARMEELVRGIAGGEVTVTEEEHGPPTGKPINIEVAGDDFPTLGRLADEVRDLVEGVAHVRNVRSDFEQGSPTLQITLDRTRAALLGLSTSQVGFVIKSAFNGLEVSTWRESDDDYRIVVRVPDEDRRLVDTLRRLYLPSANAGLVPLTTVARVEYRGGLGTITRKDHRRVVTVSAEVDETKTTGIAARLAAEELTRRVVMPPGFSLRFTGEGEFQKESEDFLGWAMAVALMLILLVLVAQFDSVTSPMVIMSAVILSLGGVFLGLGVHRMPFGIIMTAVGSISLAGVVVNNGIVLVDYTERLSGRGLSRHDAIVAAGATRLRPVLLTAITTILGLVPMVAGISYDFHAWRMQWVSESSQWWSNMAVAVIYGLGLATLLTLIVVPVLLSLAESARTLAGAVVGLPSRLWWRLFTRLTGYGPPGV